MLQVRNSLVNTASGALLTGVIAITSVTSCEATNSISPTFIDTVSSVSCVSGDTTGNIINLTPSYIDTSSGDYRINQSWANTHLVGKGHSGSNIASWSYYDDGSISNTAPVANAGTDQNGIGAGSTVTLDATGSTDSDGTIASYAWVQTAGTTVTLDDNTAAQPTFTAPSTDTAQTLTFELTVTDDGGATHTDSVDVFVDAVISVVPTGIPVIDTFLRGDDYAYVVFSYEEEDQTGFEYRLNGGTIVTDVTSPLFLSLDLDTDYTLEIRAYNADGAGGWLSKEFSTTLVTVGETLNDANGDPWTYVGRFNLEDGPWQGDTPQSYNGVQAAEIVFGTLNNKEYGTSTSTHTANGLVSRTAMYDVYGSASNEYSDTLDVTVNDGLYNSTGDKSAYVSDSATDVRTYVFKRSLGENNLLLGSKEVLEVKYYNGSEMKNVTLQLGSKVVWKLN